MSLYAAYETELPKLANIIEMLLAKNFKILSHKDKNSCPVDIEPIPYLINQLKFFSVSEMAAKPYFESLLERLISKFDKPPIKCDLTKHEIYKLVFELKLIKKYYKYFKILFVELIKILGHIWDVD